MESSFAQVVELAREQVWVRDEHFSVNGTWIESRARLKSFVPNDQTDQGRDEDPSNGGVSFRGQKRSNAVLPNVKAPRWVAPPI